MSHADDPLESLLTRKAGGREGAARALDETAQELGLTRTGSRALLAVALIRKGVGHAEVSRYLTWREFEAFSDALLEANGFSVTANITITKPRRQIDLYAESSTFAVCADCKHWERSFPRSVLERFAREQADRSSLYKKKRTIRVPVLPALITLVEPTSRVVLGVPVVPVWALRDFLATVNPFDEALAWV